LFKVSYKIAVVFAVCILTACTGMKTSKQDKQMGINTGTTQKGFEVMPQDALVVQPEWPAGIQENLELDIPGLKEQIIRMKERYLNKLPANQVFAYGKYSHTATELVETIDELLKVLDSSSDPKAVYAELKERFVLYQSVGADGGGKISFTGYYVPQFSGSLNKSEIYKYPLYRYPKELLKQDPSGKASPFYTREEIDTNRVLEGKNYELVWLDDIVNAFFIQVQGSGIIKLDNGKDMYVGYAGGNGQPYSSLGKLLISEGKLTQENVSMQTIRQYLSEHPEDAQRVLNTCKSYVFFEEKKDIAVGNVGVPLVDQCAIATDTKYFPRAAVSMVSLRKPVANEDSTNILEWKPFTRIVFNLDTGGAIKGAGRVDYFWGAGEYAALAAGNTKETGQLYFLMKKK